MPRKQNPTAEGSRVLWNALVGASTETLSFSDDYAQHLNSNCGIRPEPAAMVAAFSFDGHPRRG